MSTLFAARSAFGTYRHLQSYRRAFTSALCAEMIEHEIPAVPNLYWFWKEDLERYLSWAEDVSPSALAINLQTQRTKEDWEETVLPGLSYLAGSLDPSVRIIINGTIRPDRLVALIALFGLERLVLVTQSPIQEARHGKVIGSVGSVDHVFARPEDAFALSLTNISTLMHELQGEARKRLEEASPH